MAPRHPGARRKTQHIMGMREQTPQINCNNAKHMSHTRLFAVTKMRKVLLYANEPRVTTGPDIPDI